MSSPKPNTVPTRTRRDTYRINRLDLTAINRVLRAIGIRLDQVDAIGQNPDLKGRTLKNAVVDIVSISTDSFNEQVDDRVSTLLKEGVGIVINYDDAGDTLTIAFNRQGHISDAAAISPITLDAGADSVDRSAFNTDLATLRAEINALKDGHNTLLAALEAAGVLETS